MDARVFLFGLVVAALALPLATALKPEDVQNATLVRPGFYELQHEGEPWNILYDESTDNVYFYNPATQTTQWTDPRDMVIIPAAFKSAATEASFFSIIAVAVVPVVSFAGLMAARIWYLETYYPEKLFPLKERKQRKATNNWKTKAKKARGKMNQDGKGGRSAN